jgi:CHAT domain-containing protein/tetratricopeptide (TPR) repeat protein
LFCIGLLRVWAPGAAAKTPLDAGVRRDGTMQPGGEQRYTIELGPNECARVELRTELDFSVTLRRPDGTTTLLMDIAGEEWAPQPLTIVAGDGGAYSLLLRLPADAKAGSYTLLLVDRHPATERDRQDAEGEAHLREGMRLFQQSAREPRLAAAEHYRTAAEIFTALGNRAMEAKAIDKTGQVYNRLGETRLALEAYQRVLARYRELGQRGNEAATLNNIGLEFTNQGRPAEAIEPLKNAASIFHEIGDYWTERSPTNNLGMAYYILGDVESSSVQYRRALDIALTNYDESGEAFACMGLAGLALAQGKLQETLNYFERAIALYRKLGNHQLEALALGNIGTTHLRFGDAESALDFLFRAQEVRKLAPNRINEANTLGNIAAAYTMLGQTRKALEYAQSQLRFWQEMGNKSSESVALHGLAVIQARLGDPAAAAASFEAARTLAHDSRNRQAEAFSLSALSRLRLRQGSAAQARSLASEALTIARDGGLRLVEEEALASLAQAEAATGALDAARQHATEAIAITESIRATVAGPDQRTGYLSEHHDRYAVLLDVLMRLHRQRPGDGYERQAFEVSERARARSLIDLLAESRSNIREGVDPTLARRAQELRAAIALKRNDSDERVQPLLVQYRELQNQIRARNPRYASLVEPGAADLDTVQRELLDADTTLVEYALGEDRSYVWIVSRMSVGIHELAPRAAIEAAARRAYEVLSRPNAPDAGAALRALGRLLGPIDQITGPKRLAIVAEGALQYIPFAALLDRTGQPLNRRVEVVSLPSASTLQALRRDRSNEAPAAAGLLVVADPVFNANDPRVQAGALPPRTASASRMERSARDSGAGELERLWFTRREANAIAELAGSAGVRQLLDFDASLDGVINPDLASYRIVHFATHGLLNNKHPELSGLVFSLVDGRGRPRDGFLPAYEIYNLRLNADLVVLSACQTALGEDIRGEGLVGLTRAFMYAGGARVVASLWKVPDSATAALMQRFYRALIVERRRPAEALRAAQESVRAQRRWSAPYYWAGFTLVGEWQ